MIVDILLSIVVVMCFLLYIMINKYRKQLKRADKWKADYWACKSALDVERSKNRSDII